MKVAIVLGTRPELIKCASVIYELENRKIDYNIFNTNQHFDSNMNKNFLDELNIKYNKVITYNDKFEIGKIIDWLTPQLKSYTVCLVQGDTNSVLAGALASMYAKIKIGHIEAGIRSNDLTMQEEKNRQIVSRIADFNFCPTVKAEENLYKENLNGETIFVTGNTIADIVLKTKKEISNLKLFKVWDERGYVLLTLHRAELVDNKELLIKTIKLISKIQKEHNVRIIYPIHPRTKNKFKEFGIDIEKEIGNLKLLEPMSFKNTIGLENISDFIITDSGGLQEESCILGIPCLTLRNNTERPETLNINNQLIKLDDIDKYLSGELSIKPEIKSKENPYGLGDSGKKIIEILLKYLDN